MHVDQNKILGCLVGAAAADAMGAATEVRTQQQIKDGLKRINSLGSSDNEYIDRFMEELVLTKNGRNYYSNNFYAIRSKNPKIIGAETIIYSDPLNNSLIHTSCTLEFDEY